MIFYILALSLTLSCNAFRNSALNVSSHKKIFITSIPKCGTHLLAKLLKRLIKREIRYSNHISMYSLHNLNDLTNKHILIAHALCNKENINLVEKNKAKGIFIYRDPRDHLISLCYFIHQWPKISIPGWQELSKLDFNDLLLKLINDYESAWEQIGLHSLEDFYNAYLGWEKQIYTVKFEDLVGTLGGGSVTAQINEINNIAQYFDINLKDTELKEIAINLFGIKTTFREGKIGAWRLKFQYKHKEAFKKKYPNLLIKLGYEKDNNW